MAFKDNKHQKSAPHSYQLMLGIWSIWWNSLPCQPTEALMHGADLLMIVLWVVRR